MKLNRWPSTAWGLVSFLSLACSTAPSGNTPRPSGGTGAASGNPSSGGSGGSGTGGGSNTGGSGNIGGNNGGITPPDRPDAAIDVAKDAPACSAVEAENEVIVITTVTPIDLYFVVDKSGSMTTADVAGNPTRWAALSTAIGTFADASAMDGGSAGIGVGMAFFPITTVADGGAGGVVASCNLADYARAVVPIAPLPGNAPAVKNAVAAITPSGGTPTAPALQGAVQVATAYQAAHMDRIVALVLATDGEPNDCGSTASGVTAIASAAFLQKPSLPTYVLGIGPNTGSLDTIAAAGGTRSAYMVTASGADQLLQALNQIRVQTQTQTGTKISCSQKIPPSSSTQPLDYGAAVVTTTVGTATLRPPKVADAAACGTSDGWYYDDPMKPTIITFCPLTCNALSPDSGKSRVAISIPCLPPPVEPPH